MLIEFKIDVHLHMESEAAIQDALATMGSLLAAATGRLAELTVAVNAIEPDKAAIAQATKDIDATTDALAKAAAGAATPPA